MPDLLCKECATLEDTLRVGRVARVAQPPSCWLPLHSCRAAAAGCSPSAHRPRHHPQSPCLSACLPARTHARLQLLSLAVRHRRVGSHELNMESSRSHSIFTGERAQASWRPCWRLLLLAGSPLAASPGVAGTCNTGEQAWRQPWQQAWQQPWHGGAGTGSPGKQRGGGGHRTAWYCTARMGFVSCALTWAPACVCTAPGRRCSVCGLHPHPARRSRVRRHSLRQGGWVGGWVGAAA